MSDAYAALNCAPRPVFEGYAPDVEQFVRRDVWENEIHEREIPKRYCIERLREGQGAEPSGTGDLFRLMRCGRHFFVAPFEGAGPVCEWSRFVAEGV
ncbi:hypothetical protein K8I61_17385 [bacterium]|nr:hypothetical protein [bacterium]